MPASFPRSSAAERIVFCSLSLLNDIFKDPDESRDEVSKSAPGKAISEKIHMDIGSNITHLPVRTIMTRGVIFFSWMVFFLAPWRSSG